MAEPEPPLFLFDEYALEGALSEGNAADHEIIRNWCNGTVCVNRHVKEQFLAAFPHEKEAVDKFHVCRRKITDNSIAAAYSDQIQNLPDVDSRPVRNKILMLAMASRLGATLVTGERIGLTTWIKSLADQLHVPCLTLEEFFAGA